MATNETSERIKRIRELFNKVIKEKPKNRDKNLPHFT